MEVLETTEVKCYHCGEACEEEEILHHDDKVFCCSGCKSVYQILAESNLCDFYDLEEKTGKVKEVDRRKFLVLDDLEVAKDFIEFSNDGIARTTFFAPNIHCSSCIWLLEHLNRINPGVIQSSVNFLKKEVSVTFQSDQLSLREVAHILDSVGYPPQIEKRKKTKKSGNSLVIRLAVAGFCFGNSMLISLPDYLDMGYQIPENFRSMFGYINLLFALPVFFYSATVYFESAWKGLKHRFINIDVPISLGILTLFVRSMVEILWMEGTGFVDSLAGLVFFLLIGRWYQHKTYQALSFDRDFNSYFPVAVTKLVKNEEKLVKLEELKEGDEILIRNNELIPADAKLVEGSGNIDYSFVTGESIPSHQVQGDQLYAGGRQIGGPIVVELTRTVNNSHLTKLWNADIMTEDEESAMNNVSDRISRYFTAAILIFAMFGALLWLNIDASKAVNVFTAILIVACPCALALSVPFSYGHTLRVFGKHGFYLKNANVIEKIAGISQIIFDKTGTLTKTLPEKVAYIGRPLTDYERSLVLSATANSIHPLSKILKQHTAGSGRLLIEEFSEISGKGIMARIDDKDIRLGSREWIAREQYVDSENTQVWLRIDGEVFGRFEFTNAYRDGVFESLTSLKSKYGLHLLSGDKDGEKQRLEPYFEKLAFSQTPQQKLDYTIKLKNSGKVMMVGDGLNDAGALKSSDVGISISDDVYQFSPACDAILDAEKVNKFEKFLSFSKTAVGVVYLAFAISFLYNLVGLTFAIMGQLTPLVSSILMPISSVTVVGFITIAINWKTSRFFK